MLELSDFYFETDMTKSSGYRGSSVAAFEDKRCCVEKNQERDSTSSAKQKDSRDKAKSEAQVAIELSDFFYFIEQEKFIYVLRFLL